MLLPAVAVMFLPQAAKVMLLAIARNDVFAASGKSDVAPCGRSDVSPLRSEMMSRTRGQAGRLDLSCEHSAGPRPKTVHRTVLARHTPWARASESTSKTPRQDKRHPFGCLLLGGSGWIRTTEVSDNRFTVCPLWPLGNAPIFNCSPRRWSRWTDSNPRPADYKSAALPTELHRHVNAPLRFDRRQIVLYHMRLSLSRKKTNIFRERILDRTPPKTKDGPRGGATDASRRSRVASHQSRVASRQSPVARRVGAETSKDAPYPVGRGFNPAASSPPRPIGVHAKLLPPPQVGRGSSRRSRVRGG